MTLTVACLCPAKCGEPPIVDKASHDGPAATAGHLGDGHHGDGHQGDGRRRLYELGVQLNYSCAPGYYVRGFYRATCMAEGRWVGPRMTCRRKYHRLLTFAGLLEISVLRLAVKRQKYKQ